jgi:hypothetical protein
VTAATPLADGVYLGMPEEVYLAIPRLSGSGIQDMMVSPATFWARSWLNPKRAEALASAAMSTLTMAGAGWIKPTHAAVAELLAHHPGLEVPEPSDDPEAEEGTKAQRLGKAYHAARLEGPEALHARFARKPARADFPAERDGVPTCWTGKDIEAALAERELPKKFKDDRGVADQGRRLAEAGYQGVIFPLEMAKFEESLRGRTPIEAPFWDDMITDVERIRQSPEVAALLTEGVPEVVVLWTGPHGIRMKVRLDFLRAPGWTEFKTFDNSRGKNLYQALTEAFRWQRHYIQAVIQREAIEMLRANVLPIIGEASDQARAIIARIAMAPEELACWFIYQEKNGVPNVLARRVRFFDLTDDVKAQVAMMGGAGYDTAAAEAGQMTLAFWHRRARSEIEKARTDFIAHHEIYRRDQAWLPVNALGEFTDDDFPPYWLEERP